MNSSSCSTKYFPKVDGNSIESTDSVTKEATAPSESTTSKAAMTAAVVTTAASASYFTDDRMKKYQYGLLRLTIIAIAVFLFDFHSYHDATSSVEPSIISYFSLSAVRKYYHSYRWIGHMYIGSIGSIVNIKILDIYSNILLLLIAGAFCIHDLKYDYSIVVYLVKTFGGDFLAGKLDSIEWKLVLFFAFAIITPLSLYLHNTTAGKIDGSHSHYYHDNARVALLLFVVQFICEYGDNNLEHFMFFRHRYSFELFNVLLLVSFNLTNYEISIIRYDIIICLFYRLSNYLLIVSYHSNQSISTLINAMLFKIMSIYTGRRIIQVSDIDVALLVMKRSNCKGLCLEYLIASPAWLPIISLESIDSDLWVSMRAKFDEFMKVIPDITHLNNIVQQETILLNDSVAIIDSNEIAKFSIKVFIKYLFDREWHPDYQVLVDSTWEWRKEISVRGVGNKEVKRRAVNVFIEKLLVPSKYWDMFGDRWREPEYYSLILQPFIISPSINIGDIMCSVKLNPDSTIENAIRQQHPFPIFERYVMEDIYMNQKLVVPANTQVIMFTNDFKASSLFWIFGYGKRACAGSTLALTFLKSALLELNAGNSDKFQPLVNHIYSGRHNDGKYFSIQESLYFISTVFRVIVSSK